MTLGDIDIAGAQVMRAADLKRDDFSHVQIFEPSKLSLQTSFSAGYEQVMQFQVIGTRAA